MGESPQQAIFSNLFLVLRNLPKILFGVVVCGAVSSIFVFWSPDTYEASGTVYVYPPLFRSVAGGPAQGDDTRGLAELMPSMLPLETLNSLAMSNGLFVKLIDELALENTTVESVKAKCSTEMTPISASRGAVRYAQSISLMARSTDPEEAAKIVSAWARLFKDSVDEVTVGQLEGTYKLVESMWTKSKENLEEAENAADLFREAWNLELMKAQMTEKEKLLTRLESEQVQLEMDIAASQATLKSIGEELLEETKIETTFQAPPDVAYWLNKKGDSNDEEMGPDTGLRTEELNPIYLFFRQEEIAALSSLKGHESRKETLVAKRSELEKEIEDLRSIFVSKSTEEIRLTREVETSTVTYDLASKSLEKGKLAEMSRTSDIHLANDVIVPSKPRGIRNFHEMFLAGLMGGILSTAFVLLAPHVRSALANQQ